MWECLRVEKKIKVERINVFFNQQFTKRNFIDIINYLIINNHCIVIYDARDAFNNFIRPIVK